MHFYNLCRALELMHTKKDKGHKLVVLQKLLNSIPGSNEYFSVLRLLIPQVRMDSKLTLGPAPKKLEVATILNGGASVNAAAAGLFVPGCPDNVAFFNVRATALRYPGKESMGE